MAKLSQMSLEQITALYGHDARRTVDGRIISFTVDGYKFRLHNVIQSQNFTFSKRQTENKQIELNLK